MLRVVAHRLGPPEDVLSVEPIAFPQPEPSGIVVRMLASAINPSDRLTIGGAYPHRTPLPFVPGYEGVGIVEAVGHEVHGFHIGQRVLPLGSSGGWQTFKASPGRWCVPVPDDLTDDQAAAAYINPLTARLMLKAIAPAPGALIGINAAASAIGRMLVRMVHAAGADPLAIVRSSGARALLGHEPVSAVISDGTSLPLLDAGLDAVGGASGAALAAAVKPGRPFLHYGLPSGEPLPPGLERQVRAAVRLFWLRTWVHAANHEQLCEAMAEVFGDIRSGLAGTIVEARYPLEEFSAALAHDAIRDRKGKVLFTPL